MATLHGAPGDAVNTALSFDDRDFVRYLYRLLPRLLGACEAEVAVPYTFSRGAAEGANDDDDDDDDDDEDEDDKRNAKKRAFNPRPLPAKGRSSFLDDEDAVALALEALNATFVRRREPLPERAVAVAKRIFALAPHAAAPGVAAALIAFVRSQLIPRYPPVAALLGAGGDDDDDAGFAGGVYANDGGGGGVGAVVGETYDPRVSDPDASNAGAATAWEISALGRHWHPNVAASAR